MSRQPSHVLILLLGNICLFEDPRPDSVRLSLSMQCIEVSPQTRIPISIKNTHFGWKWRTKQKTKGSIGQIVGTKMSALLRVFLGRSAQNYMTCFCRNLLLFQTRAHSWFSLSFEILLYVQNAQRVQRYFFATTIRTCWRWVPNTTSRPFEIIHTHSW